MSWWKQAKGHRDLLKKRETITGIYVSPDEKTTGSRFFIRRNIDACNCFSFFLKVTMTFCLLMVTDVWAQEKPQYLFYFQDDSTTGVQELSLGASGFHAAAPLYQKRLCIRKMDAKDAACSDPMPFVRNGGIHYDPDTQRVYVATQGSETGARQIINWSKLTLAEFFHLQPEVNIRSFPVSPGGIQKRIGEIQEVYTRDNLLFEACQEAFIRVTGLTSEKVAEIFGLDNPSAAQFFKSQENLCRILALKGEQNPFQKGAGKNALNKLWLTYGSPDPLGRSLDQYKDQMSAIALFYFLLRLQDIDKSVVSVIGQIQSKEPNFDPCPLADLMRTLGSDGNLNTQPPAYSRIWAKIDARGDLIQTLRTHPFMKPDTQLISELATLSLYLEEFDVKRPKALESELSEQQRVKLREIFLGREVFNRAAPAEINRLSQSFYVGIVGLAKAVKLMHQFFTLMQMINKWEGRDAIASEIQAFLTGGVESQSILNGNTFFSLLLRPREIIDETKQLLFLGTEARAAALRVQNVQAQPPSPGSTIACPQLDHSRLRSYQFYVDTSNEVHGHENFRNNLHAVAGQIAAVQAGNQPPGDMLIKLISGGSGVLEYFMTEDVPGLVSGYLGYLKVLLRGLLRQPSIDSYLFDFAEGALSNPRNFELDSIPGFGLKSEGETLFRVYFNLVREARLLVDEFMVVSGPMINRVPPGRQVELTNFIRNLVSEDSVKKLLFGCVTDKSLRQVAVSDFSWECEPAFDAEADEVVGYKDLKQFGALLTQVQVYKAFDQLSKPLEILQQREYTLNRQALLHYVSHASLWGFLKMKIQDIIVGFQGQAAIIVQEMKRLSTQRYEALSQLETGLTIRLTLLGLLMKEVQAVAEGTVSPSPRGQRLAEAKTALMVGRKAADELTDAQKAELGKDDRILVLGVPRVSQPIRYYPVTRTDYHAISEKLDHAYVGEPATRSEVSRVVADNNDFRDGNILLRVLTHPHGSSSKSTLFTSQEGKVRLYDKPQVAQSKLLSSSYDPYVMEVLSGPIEDFFSSKSGREDLRRIIRGSLSSAPPPAPTEAAPLVAQARAYQVSETGGLASEQSAVGFPGQTYRIYQTTLDPQAQVRLTKFLTQPVQDPRFAMLFEGAYLDTKVFSAVRDPERLQKWTERIQAWIGQFLTTGHPGIQKATWVSESFSPGLTRTAQFKTHVITLPLVPLLQGFMAAESPNLKLTGLSSQLRALEPEIASIQEEFQKLDSADADGKAQLAQRLKQKQVQYERLFDDVESLAEKDLLAFQVMIRDQKAIDNPYFATHRYFPENTEPVTDGTASQVIHVVMHEFNIWEIADLEQRTSLTRPQLLVHHEDKPLIRSHLLGQYRFHPGAMHHVWDDWDGNESARAQAPQGCDAACQNIYFYYGGSHLMAFNMRNGVWFRSEGWNRLGVELDDTVAGEGGTDHVRNAMSQVFAKHNNDLKDVTPVPYRLWLTIPHSPPFFNPLAGEWTFQRVFLTADGVGPTKQWMWGTRGLGTLLGEGVSPRSWVYVNEALAQPGSEFHLHMHPGERVTDGAKTQYAYKNFRAVLWKHFNHVDVHPTAGANEFLLTHPAKTHPLKAWMFYNFYENGLPNHESFLVNFFSFDKKLKGTIGVGDSSWQFPGALQFYKDIGWLDIFKGRDVKSYAWSFIASRSVNYDSTPLCMSLAYSVKGTTADRSTLLNNEMRPREYFLSSFPNSSESAQAEQFSVEALASQAQPLPEVGPTLLNVVPYINKAGKTGWMFSELRGSYTPMLVPGDQSVGIQNIVGRIRDSSGHVVFETAAAVKKPPRPEVNTWIPGMCVPFHTQSAITGMTVVQ